MSIYVLASIIARYRFAAGSILAATLAAALLSCFLLPRRYTSTFTLLSTEGAANPLLQSLNQNFYNTGMKTWVLPRVIRSEEFLEDVMKKRFSIWGDGKPVLVSLADLAGKNSRREVLECADRYVRVSTDEMTGSLTVGVETPYPELSYKAAGYILEKLDRYAEDTRRTLRGSNAQFYESRLAEARSGLRLVEEELGEYLEKNQGWLESDDPGAVLTLQQLKRKQEIYAGVYFELCKQQEMDDLKITALVPPLGILERPDVPTLKSFPRRKILLMGGMLAGVLLSLSSIVGWDFYRKLRTA